MKLVQLGLWALILSSVCLSIASTVYWSLFYNNTFMNSASFTDKLNIKYGQINGVWVIQNWSVAVNALAVIILPICVLFRHSKKYRSFILGALVLLSAITMYDSVSTPKMLPLAKLTKIAQCGMNDKELCDVYTHWVNALNVASVSSPLASASSAILAINVFLK